MPPFLHRFEVKRKLRPDELERGLVYLIKDGIATQLMVSLSTGVFLVAFALELGASNTVIGVLAAIPPMAQLLQLPSVFVVEKIANRRALSFYAALITRSALIAMALLPLYLDRRTALYAFTAALLIQSCFGALSACSWNSWMRDLVPDDRLGTFFSKRMAYATAVSIPAGIGAGLFADWWNGYFTGLDVYAYSFIFSLGAVAGVTGIFYFIRIPEPAMIPDRTKLSELFSLPFRDLNFRRLILFMGSWSFAVNLAAPFFTVYMLKRLELKMSLIILLSVLSQVFNIVFLRIWGPMSDRFSNKSVLRISGPLFMICILAWTFTTLPEKYILTLPLLVIIHVLMGISTAGVVLGTGNIGLKLAPQGKATAYLASINLVNAVCAGVAPFIGGLSADFFAGRELALVFNWSGPRTDFRFHTLNLQQWDFFFFTAFLIGLYSLHRLASVSEVGEVNEEIVIHELAGEVRRTLRSLSTVAGLRQMTYLPVSIYRGMKYRNLKRKRTKKKKSPG